MSAQQTSKKRRALPLYALFAAGFISVTGEAMTSIAIPWFVLQTTGSAAQTGLTAFVSITPIIISSFFGGALIDRIGYKRISIAADLASGMTVALIPLLHFTVGLAFWQLLVLVFLTNLLDAPGATSRSAMLPDLAEMAGMPLERATAFLDGVSRATRMVGAPMAGVFIAFFGPVNILWLDAITFGISALMITLLVPVVAAAARKTEDSNYMDDMREGLAFIRFEPVLLTVVVVVMLTNFLDAALSSIFMPVFAERTYGLDSGSVNLGVMEGALGAGALVGTLLMGIFSNRFPRRWLLAGGFGLASIRFFLLAIAPPFVALALGIGLLGLPVGALNPTISTLLYERTPENMRARVLGNVRGGAWVAIPLGALLAGFAAEWFSLSLMLVICGGLYLALSIYLAASPALRADDAARREMAAQPAAIAD